MPIYQYVCTRCAYQFDRLQRSLKAPFPPCPKCGGITRRVFSAPNIIVR
jgi:putative FmdB family regulatory protein